MLKCVESKRSPWRMVESVREGEVSCWFVTSMSTPKCLTKTMHPEAVFGLFEGPNLVPYTMSWTQFSASQIACSLKRCRDCRNWPPMSPWFVTRLGFAEAWSIQCLHAEPCLNSFDPRSSRGSSQLSPKNHIESSYLMGKPGKTNILNGPPAWGPDLNMLDMVAWQLAVWVRGLSMFWRRPRGCLSTARQDSWSPSGYPGAPRDRARVVYRFEHFGMVTSPWTHMTCGDDRTQQVFCSGQRDRALVTWNRWSI